MHVYVTPPVWIVQCNLSNIQITVQDRLFLHDAVQTVWDDRTDGWLEEWGGGSSGVRTSLKK